MMRFSLIALVLPLLAGCSSDPEAKQTPGVFVLGVDGMDPVILQRMVDAGEMPAFAQLMGEGSFHDLGTSWPPQSPVAWSNFVTGMNPGGHGIYDFIHRDPATYHPISSATPPSDAEPPGTMEIGGYIIPLGGDDPVNNRGGVPFWDLLHASGVDTEIYRIPANYPVPEIEAKVLGGMGTVDMRGDFGTYTFYSSQPLWNPEIKGDVELVRVVDTDLDGQRDRVRSKLKGPPDIFHLEPGQIPGPHDYLTVPLEVSIDPAADVVYIQAGSGEAVLKPGEWSDWIEVDFDALPYGMMALSGTVRFYLKSIREPFQLYASPVNINPLNPAQPITSPDDFTEELAERLGPFFTQGMPEETNALKDGVFDDDDYEAQVALVQEDTVAMLEMALERFDSGDMSFVYVSDVDLQCHMLWRHGDPKFQGEAAHPAHDAEAAVDHADDIEGYYKSVDALLARTRAELPADTMLMVMSDHGFQPYTRKFHLNNWLVQEGYLVLSEQCDESGECAPGTAGSIAAGHVDWSQTRAYGLGFNGLYLNLSGREGQGIVAEGDADALLTEISAKLLAVTDSNRAGSQVVLEVAKASEIYTGQRVSEAPDLVIGYDRHYGASDESTLGEIVDPNSHSVPLEDNTDRWSGNHLMAPSVVPGVLLLNREIGAGDYDLTDLTTTLLDYYGLQAADGMVGTSILGN
jgi:predicted AlkP superfamily phosphohydrolase/phosphomutase